MRWNIYIILSWEWIRKEQSGKPRIDGNDNINWEWIELTRESVILNCRIYLWVT